MYRGDAKGGYGWKERREGDQLRTSSCGERLNSLRKGGMETPITDWMNRSFCKRTPPYLSPKWRFLAKETTNTEGMPADVR